MRLSLAIAASLPLACSAFLLSQPQRAGFMPDKHRTSSGTSPKSKSLLSSGSEMDNLNPFAVSSSGFPSLGDGFPSMGGDVGVGYPSLGEISMSRPPKRGVLVRNVAADAAYEIRVLDKDYKLGITAVVESIVVVKEARFAICRTKDRAAAILDELVFPVDVDSVQMNALVKMANNMLRKRNIELLWTAHTLTVKGLKRPNTDYLPWKKPYAERLAQSAMLGAEYDDQVMMDGEFEDAMAVEDEEGALLEEFGEEEMDASSYERMDAAFFADVNDEEYVGDSPEGLDKRALLLEPDMLGEFDYKRAKYRVVVYDEPVTLVAQWMEDGTWRLLKSVEAELVEDAAAYQQLQNLEVELVDA